MRSAEVREEIVKVAGELSALGLTAATWGNVSARLTEDSFAITPSGVSYEVLKPRDIVEVKFDLSFRGTRKPSTEAPLHAEIYRNRKDVKAVVHTHSTFASAFAIARKSLPPVLEELAQIVGGSVECADYASPGTERLAREALKALGNKNAVFLANHGLVGVGRNLREALKVCIVVERAAKAAIFARILGEVRVLGDEEVKKLRKFYLEEYEGGKP